jgi:hypothetical protein
MNQKVQGAHVSIIRHQKTTKNVEETKISNKNKIKKTKLKTKTKYKKSCSLELTRLQRMTKEGNSR